MKLVETAMEAVETTLEDVKVVETAMEVIEATVEAGGGSGRGIGVGGGNSRGGQGGGRGGGGANSQGADVGGKGGSDGEVWGGGDAMVVEVKAVEAVEAVEVSFKQPPFIHFKKHSIEKIKSLRPAGSSRPIGNRLKEIESGSGHARARGA